MTVPRRLLALVAVALAACSESQAVVGGNTDAAPEATADAVPDAKPVDAAPDVAADAAPDVAADVAPDAAPDVASDVAADGMDARAGCASDMDCASTPTTPACDTATGRCVACVASNDRCPRGTFCDPTTSQCAPGCRNDDDCRVAVSEDAGVTQRRCNASTRACVECVTNEHCPAGTLCVGNTCVAGCNAMQPCPTGQTCCGGACVDPQSNVAHCGRCDTRCAAANATPACTNGACAVGACTGAFADCDRAAANGCETDTRTSTMHCGACGAACEQRPETDVECAAGRCAYACRAGFADCDGMTSNGCEADTRASAMHCGACGRACALANATATCAAGQCAVARCNDGYGDCDGNAANGCETDLRTATAHCGACRMACPAPSNTVPACVTGRCALTCAAGFGECDGDGSNGCETTLATTTEHCGSCGRSCRGANVSAATCAAGQCRITACAAGFADCDMNAANGCETDTRVSTAHCGRCDNACSAPGGTAVCRAGACGVGACATGRGDCDGNAANGCETDLGASAMHCGACGAACAPANATGACAAGRCGVGACSAGWGDCDGNAANGCETDLRTTTAHCGRCANACAFANAGASCAMGACVLGSCAAGFADCDRTAANGCEVNTATSTAHCGGCGASCAPPNATGACAMGRCGVAACATGFGDCDGNAANGCEVNTRTAAAHCGVCGRACGAGQACVAGACQPLTGCAAIQMSFPSAGSGRYSIDPDGPGGAAPFDAYCDMTSDGGGWTLVMMMASAPAGTLGFDAAAWTDASTLNPSVVDPTMNVSMKSAAFNTLPFGAIRLCLGGLQACVNEPVSVASARALFSGGERLGARSVSDLRVWGYGGGLGCNRIAFNVYDVGTGSPGASRARFRYGILLNNESACEGSVDGGRGLGGRGYYGTQISAGQGDGIVGVSHERGWIFVR